MPMCDWSSDVCSSDLITLVLCKLDPNNQYLGVGESDSGTLRWPQGGQTAPLAPGPLASSPASHPFCLFPSHWPTLFLAPHPPEPSHHSQIPGWISFLGHAGFQDANRFKLFKVNISLGFPNGSVVKNHLSVKERQEIPGSRRSPGKGNGNSDRRAHV